MPNKRTKNKKPTDPRLTYVLDVLDETCADRVLPDSSRGLVELVMSMFENAIKRGVEIERLQQLVALLWADNDDQTFSDPEDRRTAMLEVAVLQHETYCTCCRNRRAA